MAVTAQSVHWIGRLARTRRAHPVDRADDLRQEDDISLTRMYSPSENISLSRRPSVTSPATDPPDEYTASLETASATVTSDTSATTRGPGTDVPNTLSPPAQIAEIPGRPVVELPPPNPTVSDSLADLLLPNKAQELADFISTNLNEITWITFLLAGVIVYFVKGYTMPAFLSLNVLAFFAAVRVPSQIRRLIHPNFICAAITIGGIGVLAVYRHDDLMAGEAE